MSFKAVDIFFYKAIGCEVFVVTTIFKYLTVVLTIVQVGDFVDVGFVGDQGVLKRHTPFF